MDMQKKSSTAKSAIESAGDSYEMQRLKAELAESPNSEEIQRKIKRLRRKINLVKKLEDMEDRNFEKRMSQREVFENWKANETFYREMGERLRKKFLKWKAGEGAFSGEEWQLLNRVYDLATSLSGVEKGSEAYYKWLRRGEEKLKTRSRRRASKKGLRKKPGSSGGYGRKGLHELRF